MGGDIVSKYRYRYTARDYAILRAYNREMGKDVTILYKNVIISVNFFIEYVILRKFKKK